MNTYYIRDGMQKILGIIEEDNNGNKKVYDFYRKILGTYNKRQDITYDFYGRIFARGDASSGLIYANKR